MKKNIGVTLYPFLFIVCIIILVVGIIGIAIKALVSEAFFKFIGGIYD
jgi:hypothetical protein